MYWVRIDSTYIRASQWQSYSISCTFRSNSPSLAESLKLAAAPCQEKFKFWIKLSNFPSKHPIQSAARVTWHDLRAKPAAPVNTIGCSAWVPLLSAHAPANAGACNVDRLKFCTWLAGWTPWVSVWDFGRLDRKDGMHGMGRLILDVDI